MYKHILVAVSFDAERDGNKAIEVARKLVDKDGVLTLLHVVEEVPGYAATYMPAGYREKTLVAINDQISEMAALVDGAQGIVVEGHSGRTILDWSASHDVDCIVVASHRPGMQDYLLGSTAAQVVRHAPCAVHVVR